MSLSKERQEYHLTPRGWLADSFFGDILGGRDIVPTPKDRVLTVVCVDQMFTPGENSVFSDHVSWRSKNDEKIRRLKKKFGRRPEWFGYDVAKLSKAGR